MTSLITLGIWLGSFLILADESSPSPQPQPTFRVFADLKHTGILTGPLASSSRAPNEFGIAVPLPAVSGTRDRWSDTLDDDDQVVKRLGRSFPSTAILAGACAFFERTAAGGAGRRRATITRGHWRRERTG
jgi:hypothetical protein